jgi:hypothetical protein
MKKIYTTAMLCLFLLSAGCRSNGVKDWKIQFDAIIQDISTIKTDSKGGIEDYRKYFICCEKLSGWSDGTPYAVDLLKDHLLTSEHMPVRAASAEVLGRIGKRKDVNALINALHDSSAFVREKVLKSLKSLTHEDFGTDKAKWSDWWQKIEKEEKEKKDDK